MMAMKLNYEFEIALGNDNKDNDYFGIVEDDDDDL
jgi:hypothetical protein